MSLKQEVRILLLLSLFKIYILYYFDNKKLEKLSKDVNENKLEWFSHENNLRAEDRKKVNFEPFLKKFRILFYYFKQIETESLIEKQNMLKNEIERLKSGLYEKDEMINKILKENEQLQHATIINKVFLPIFSSQAYFF